MKNYEVVLAFICATCIFIAGIVNAHENGYWFHIPEDVRYVWIGSKVCPNGVRLWKEKESELWFPVYFSHDQMHLGIPQLKPDCELQEIQERSFQ